MTAGSLGDYLKRHGGMGYAVLEYKVFVYYDRYRGLPESVIKYAGKSDSIDYTEVECALPVFKTHCKIYQTSLYSKVARD
jgi:hypothetical protein